MKQAVKIPSETAKVINDILSRGNDVIIKYHENKGEVEVLEQKVTAKNKLKITNE